jgi:excisionase family DNA binding protein
MDDEFFTVPELAALLRISPSTVYTKAAGWPHHRIGKKIRFSRADVEAIKEMTHRTPAPVMQARSIRIGTERAKARNRPYNLGTASKSRLVIMTSGGFSVVAGP